MFSVDRRSIDVTGDKNAKTAVFVIFDIFGFFPQTQQGADIIATTGNHLVSQSPPYFTPRRAPSCMTAR